MRTCDSGVLLRRARPVAAFGLALAFTLSACGGGGEKAAQTDTGMAMAPDTTAMAMAGPPPTPGNPPAGATPEMVALGDSIFHGQVASGACFTCHGVDAKGTQLAPSLVDTLWQTGDGTYAFIQKRVTDGMPNPTPPFPGPMLPMGGANLTQDQIKAVAAYVYAISHQGG